MSQGVVPSGSVQQVEGLQHKKNAGILAVIGLFFAGPVFGILAIWQASKESSRGVRATGWMILGIIDIIAGIVMAMMIL